MVNAIATGVGGAVGVDIPVEAAVEVDPGGRGVSIDSATPWGRVEPPERLAGALAWLASMLGLEGGLLVRVRSGIPPASGLKSSSAVVNAVTAALLDAAGERLNAVGVARLGVEVARRAGLTVTGAFDDSLATVAGGVFVTDNPSMRILRHYTVEDGLYVVAAVRGERRIDTVDPEAFRALRGAYERAARLALEGEWLAAMTLNGLTTLAATGWDPLAAELAARALASPGVLAAGVSGKGPAVFAVTRDPGAVREAWSGFTGIVILEAGILGGG